MILQKDATPEERILYKLIVNRAIEKSSYNKIYSKIKNPIDKLIMYYIFDCGETVNNTSVLIGRTRLTIWKRKTKILNQLKFLISNKHLSVDVNTI